MAARLSLFIGGFETRVASAKADSALPRFSTRHSRAGLLHSVASRLRLENVSGISYWRIVRQNECSPGSHRCISV